MRRESPWMMASSISRAVAVALVEELEDLERDRRLDAVRDVA